MVTRILGFSIVLEGNIADNVAIKDKYMIQGSMARISLILPELVAAAFASFGSDNGTASIMLECHGFIGSSRLQGTLKPLARRYLHQLNSPILASMHL